MGASKEDVMGVRDKINLVLHNFFIEEDQDPPDAESASCSFVPITGAVTQLPVRSGNDATASPVPPQESLSSSSCSSSSNSSSNCGNDLIGSSNIISCLGVASRSSNVNSQQLTNSRCAKESRTCGESGCEESISIVRRRGHKETNDCRDIVSSPLPVGLGIEEEKDNKLVILKDLVGSQLRLIKGLEKRLSDSESKCAAVCIERDQLLITLNSQREQHELFRTQSEAIIKGKDERIEELEKQLAVVSEKKSTEDKATCVTPPPPSPPPQDTTSPRTHQSQMSYEDDMDTPPQKRAKLDLEIRYNTTSKHFLAPPATQKSFLPSHYQNLRTPHQYRQHHPHHHQRRSDSPPQLSPAVTPKSAHHTSGRPREIRSYLGHELNDEDDGTVGPPDEFQDELERINRTPTVSTSHTHNQVKIRSAANHLSHHQSYPSFSSRAQQGSSESKSSSSSGFARPPLTTKPRHTRFMFPEGKKRFLNSNNSNSSSNSGNFFLPVNKTSPFFPSELSFLKSNHHHQSMLSSNKHAGSQHSAGMRNRSNNFLNLNRPLAKKAPVVIVPPPQSHITPSSSSSSHFRSLDAASAGQLSSHSRRTEEEQAALVPSITPPVTQKKRKVGRPPGSGLKSKLIPRPSFSTSFYSPSSGSGTSMQSSGQLPNGSISLQELPPAPPPPQRFSQRGRLLKPNRARYSPDPDVSVVNTREKYLTTKRGYFVGEPFTHPGYPGDDEGHIHHQQESAGTLSTAASGALPSREIETAADGEALPIPPPENLISCNSPLEPFEDGSEGSMLFVEVPNWRVNVLEGYTDSEEKELPEDDMSEEAFHKRHQKLEAKEKQRKRWDSQRMREESYLERLKRKQEERERQKELRRQQRKRNKGRNGASEEETVTPNSDEIKAIHIGTELPVGAFGHPLPLVEKVDFALPWQVVPTTTTNKTTTPPPVVVVDEENSVVIDDKDASAPAIESMESSTPPPIRLTASSPSSSSISLPSIPSPSPGNSPPPPVIYPELEEASSDVDSQATTVPEIVDTDENSPTLLENEETNCKALQENGNDSMDIEECSPKSPVFTVDLVDYVNSDQSSGTHGGETSDDPIDIGSGGDDNCDTIKSPVTPTPSISIPLHSPTSNGKKSNSVNQVNCNSPTSSNNRLKDLRPRNSTIVRFPLSFTTSSSSTVASSSTVSSTSTSPPQPSQVSKTSITFFIPNNVPNPLAPSRNLRRSSGSAPSTSASSTTLSSSATSIKSSSSTSSGSSIDNRRDS